MFKDPVVILKEIMSLLFKDPITVTQLNFDHAQSNSRKRSKKIKSPQINFICKKQLIKCSCTYQPHSFCKMLKNFLEPNQSYEDVPFLGPKQSNLSSTIFFWYKPLLLLSFTYWPFSLCKIKKKILQQIQSYKDASFLGQKWFI